MSDLGRYPGRWATDPVRLAECIDRHDADIGRQDPRVVDLIDRQDLDRRALVEELDQRRCPELEGRDDVPDGARNLPTGSPPAHRTRVERPAPCGRSGGPSALTLALPCRACCICEVQPPGGVRMARGRETMQGAPCSRRRSRNGNSAVIDARKAARSQLPRSTVVERHDAPSPGRTEGRAPTEWPRPVETSPERATHALRRATAPLVAVVLAVAVIAALVVGPASPSAKAWSPGAATRSADRSGAGSPSHRRRRTTARCCS